MTSASESNANSGLAMRTLDWKLTLDSFCNPFVTCARSGCGPNGLKIASLCVHIWVSDLKVLLVILLSLT